MKHYGLNIPEGSEVTNLTTASGTADPSVDLNPGELFFRTDLNEMRLYNGTSWISLSEAGAGGITDYISIRDEKPIDTDGGTFDSGAWRTRDLNTIASDSGGHASLSSNQITLTAGTYRVKASAPAYFVTNHKTRLRNITDNIDTIIGTTERINSSSDSSSRSFIEGRFTIASSKTFEVQHRCQASKSSNGFGTAFNFGVIEVYTTVEFWKEP